MIARKQQKSFPFRIYEEKCGKNKSEKGFFFFSTHIGDTWTIFSTRTSIAKILRKRRQLLLRWAKAAGGGGSTQKIPAVAVASSRSRVRGPPEPSALGGVRKGQPCSQRLQNLLACTNPCLQGDPRRYQVLYWGNKILLT